MTPALLLSLTAAAWAAGPAQPAPPVDFDRGSIAVPPELKFRETTPLSRIRRFPAGSGDDQLGADWQGADSQVAGPAGPFAASDAGLWIADRVNGRLVLVDVATRRTIETVRLPFESVHEPYDLYFDGADFYTLVPMFPGYSIRRFSRSGRPLGCWTVDRGAQANQAAFIVFASASRVVINLLSETLDAVLSSGDATSCPAATAESRRAGRSYAHDGRVLETSFVHGAGTMGLRFQRPDGSARVFSVARWAELLYELTLEGADAAGNLYVAELQLADAPGGRKVTLLHKVSPEGKTLGSVDRGSLPENDLYRRYTVTPGGRAFTLAVSPSHSDLLELMFRKK
jgi:hypothetical protein